MKNRNKIRWAPLTALVITVTAFLRVSLAFGDLVFEDPSCPASLRQLSSYYQKATVNSEAMDPVFEWAVTHGRRPDSLYHFAIANLEGRVVEIIETLPPGHRAEAIDNLSLDSGLSVENIQAMIDYYALRYYEEPRLAGDTASFWGRLEDVNRSLRMTEPEPGSPESRYLFYLHALTQDSVPELARKLGVSESKVRGDLSRLKLSILSEFDRGGLLQEAKRRFDLNQPIAQIAADLKVGEQALRFVLHYERELNRGSEWSSAERATLRRLIGEGATYAQIADALNRASNTPAQSPGYRTEGAVAAKADQLQLTTSRVRTYPADIALRGFGQVKRNGHLTDAAKKYIRAHFLDSLDEVADSLGVQPESLAAFIRRHNLIFENLPPAPNGENPAKPPRPPSRTATPTPSAATVINPSSLLTDELPAHAIRTAVLPDSAQAIPINPTRGKQVLERYKNIPDPEKVPAHVLKTLPNKPLNQLTFEELDAALVEIANFHFKGVKNLTKTRKITRSQYAAPGATAGKTGQTIFRAWSIKKYQRDNPNLTPLNTKEIFDEDKGGKKMAVWLEEFKASHGYKPTLAEGTLIVKALQNKAIQDHSFEELDAALAEIANTQFDGVKNLLLGKKFLKSQYAAPGATAGQTGGTILRAWAIKKYQRDNPNLTPLNTTDIYIEDKGGKKMAVWLEEFKASHGHKPTLSEGTLIVKALQNKAIQDHSFEELDAALAEIANTQFDGVKKLLLGKKFLKSQYAAPGATAGTTGETIFRAWSIRKYQRDNPNLTPLNTTDIYNEDKGGKKMSAWLEEFRKSHQ